MSAEKVYGQVYFVEAIGFNLVKIGFTTVGLESRVSAIQVGCPFLVKLVAHIDGCTRADERAYHKRFEEFRSRGEWFRCAGVLRSFVDALAGLKTKETLTLSSSGVCVGPTRSTL